MANKFTRFLRGVGDGLTNPKGVMANWDHATRLYVEDTYRLSPRTKFLFYVRFELDKSVVSSLTFSQKHADEVGYLIKSTDLPKFKFDTVTKNQYNRKKIFYKNFTYEPITMTFHDDSNGVMNALWALYMSSYVQDRLNPLAAYSSTALRPAGTSLDGFRYGLDKPGRTSNFIKSISIYTMSRRRFLGYTLINPKITSWSHGSGDYAEVAFNENTMSIEYEAAIYTGGNVSIDNPKGFATLYYDTVPSPLTVAGGGVDNLLGSGGVLDGLESIFGDIQSGNAFDLTNGGALNTVIKAVNTARNASTLTGSSVGNELLNLVRSPAAITNTLNTVSGLVGAVFPKTTGTITGETQATQKPVVVPVNNTAPITQPPSNPVAQSFPVSGAGSVSGTPLTTTNNS
jgi:hypothetical protein